MNGYNSIVEAALPRSVSLEAEVYKTLTTNLKENAFRKRIKPSKHDTLMKGAVDGQSLTCRYQTVDEEGSSIWLRGWEAHLSTYTLNKVEYLILDAVTLLYPPSSRNNIGPKLDYLEAILEVIADHYKVARLISPTFEVAKRLKSTPSDYVLDKCAVKRVAKNKRVMLKLGTNMLNRKTLDFHCLTNV